MELVEFLTSKEIIVVYIVAAVLCLICVAVYLVEKYNVKLRQKHNTRELNKLVEELKDEVYEENNKVVYNEPVLSEINSETEVLEEASSVVELLEATGELKVSLDEEDCEKVKEETIQDVKSDNVKDEVIQKLEEEKVTDEVVQKLKEEILEPIIIEEVALEEELTEVEELKEKKEEPELEYTSIEPDPATAREELEKITEELRKQELKKNNEVVSEEVENIKLTNYEESQEENAIISLEELMKKSKEMYALNEITQYADEGNVPISLTEFEKQVGEANKDVYNEPFIISNVVSEKEVIEELEEEKKESVKLDDFNTVKVEVKEEVKKFKSSPIISPIYGIRDEVKENDLELENTANYEKLDEEIRKTNEFLMTLKELQKHLD